MSSVPLRDIMINARQESQRMRHYYLGVEHLFIALLELPGGLAGSILEDHGLTPGYVVDAVRRKIGKGGKQRLWAGLPNTPRADVILSIASDLAMEAGHDEIDERDLLAAILEERDSISVRVLASFGLNLDQLARAVQTRTRAATAADTPSHTRVVFGPRYEAVTDISDGILFILRRMFHGYAVVRIERQLTGGYSEAVLLVVTPIQADGREDAPVVVKVDHADEILDEAKRYDLHVKNTLPPLTARLEDRPTAPETSDLAGLKYTFVGQGNGAPMDLRALAQFWSGGRLGAWLESHLFPAFATTWWGQRRPYRFPVWMEYDWLLPPMLTLEAVPDDEPSSAKSVLLKDPVKRSRLHALDYGDVAVVENFAVQKVDRERRSIRVAIGRGTEAARRAYAIEVEGVDLAQDAFYRGEVVDRLIGRVVKTRDEAMYHAARMLEPKFDLKADAIPGWTEGQWLPNPLRRYESLLDRQVNGSVSRIHGDLHLGNILAGPGNSPFLIDFAHAREGHTLADWATLEVSLLSDVVLPAAGETWEAAYSVLGLLETLNRGQRPEADGNPALSEAIKTVTALRRIVDGCLAAPGVWSEYFVALAFCALRAMTWDTMSIGGRRLMLLVAALAMDELRRRVKSEHGADVTTDREADLTDTGSGPKM